MPPAASKLAFMHSQHSIRRGIFFWSAVVICAVVFAVTIAWIQQNGSEPDGGHSADARSAELERIIDGDTIVVTLDGVEERVRLLNIDTPETVHPDQPVECGGPEASDRLAELLSPGDDVVLEFDQEPRDQYDRLLAGVYADDVFINAELARDGWAEPAYFEPNDRFLAVVEKAWGEAEDAKAGLFAEDLGCDVGEPIG